MKRGLLWVEVSGKYVTLRDGAKMPAPKNGYSLMWNFGHASMTRKEFARWAGVEFPAGEGIYGIACNFAVVSRYRKVVEETKVAVTERNTRWEEVK